jgi:hypothetical protein
MNALVEELWTEAGLLIETEHNLPHVHLKNELAERAEAITNSMDDRRNHRNEY